VTYSIDTSSLIEAWERRYPKDCFPSLWERLEVLVQGGRLRASSEVGEELKKKDDGVIKWAKGQAGLFVPVDEDQQHALISILQAHPKLVDSRKGRSAGDPWVIALALVQGCTVVTEEKSAGLNNPRIPDVCTALGVPCISMLELIRLEKWSF
jgi:hypothetical protein